MTDGLAERTRTPRRSRLLTLVLVAAALGGVREWAFARNRRRYGDPRETGAGTAR